MDLKPVDKISAYRFSNSTVYKIRSVAFPSTLTLSQTCTIPTSGIRASRSTGSSMDEV